MSVTQATGKSTPDHSSYLVLKQIKKKNKLKFCFRKLQNENERRYKWGLFVCLPVTMTQLFGLVLIYLNEVTKNKQTIKQTKNSVQYFSCNMQKSRYAAFQ